MNSAQLELLKIDKQWYGEVKKNPDLPLFVCLGEKHELGMFDLYFKYQISEESSTNDLFLVFYQDFTDAKQYGESLVKELKETYTEIRKKTPDIPEWEEIPNVPQQVKTDAYKAVKAIEFLHSSLFKDRKIFIHLSPLHISDIKAFEAWLQEWTELIAAKEIKVVITDHCNFPAFSNLPYKRKEFRVRIDIQNLMNNIAAQTNNKKGSPETNYQQQILIASNFLSNSKNEEAVVALEKAIRIAQRQNLVEAQASARLMKAQTLRVMNKKDEAQEEFQEILKIAGGDTYFGAQMYMNYGVFLLTTAKKNKAMQCFEKAVEIGEKINDDALQMECLRLIGQLNDFRLSLKSPMPYYEKSVEIGKRLPKEAVRDSSLPYTASLLLKKYGKSSSKGEALDKDMSELIGKDWQDLIKPPKENYNA